MTKSSTTTRSALTARDLEFAQWMAKWRAVQRDQLQREFDRRDGRTRRKEVYERRLRALRAAQLVEWDTPLGRPGVHWLTQNGMKFAGVPGTPARWSHAELVHDLAVIDLAHHLQDLQPAHTVVTEQEIRRAEPGPGTGPGARLRADLELGVGRAKGGRAYPDLASIGPDRSGVERTWLHEYERTQKGRQRLVTIMLAYIYARHVDGVAYWVPPELVAPTQAAADEANDKGEREGFRRCITVRPWQSSPS
ncbi:hypothetical protein [Streptomyces sp. NPDC049879]|uniref:hypothetical protein n=1 Tax=Streptomyces sp. NPDC049879 TaxID=3365598 RepID=UPI0037BD72CA